ncbi:hypothetical protein I3F58_14455 [Streptomyces sp. MUM 203J]|uniref:hypothetical protein n=1 Tax=Streptomyces sp. MUM 203J TaxID=2791990 RepID=UPI001F03C367|nr:hypothetical protein [Streptomyces sp. MUM 203J]MCH0540748.1 hypothetical protein [Streptomyces sp. MUM 203J]
MGSLRNPVGPLPSSIYWRRRAIAAGLILLLMALIVWFVSSGDGDPQKGSGGASASSPAPSITPGPKPSGPAISSGPGNASGNGGADGGDGGTGGSAGPGDGGTGSGSDGSGADSGAGSTTSGAGASGSGAGPGSGTAAGHRVPADSSLPDCAAGALRLTLESTKVSYEPEEKPEFRIVAGNSSATTCKTDLGPAAAVLTISDDSDEEIWSSKDCPDGTGALWVSVPAGGTVTQTVEWDRRPSDADRCDTPSKRSAEPGTYLAELTAPGQKIQRASITLAKD